MDMPVMPHDIVYAQLSPPVVERPTAPQDLPDSTYADHLDRVLDRLRAQKLDALVIYADREHGANFGYLTGFEPRFEEACLVLHARGAAYALLGNECLKMHRYSRLPVEPLHTPYFSLPNQPMAGERALSDCLRDAGIVPGMAVGAVGWKLFTTANEHNARLFDLPGFIMDAVFAAVTPGGTVENATGLFIHPEQGARATVDADEIAQYEYAAALAASCVYGVLESLEVGVTEQQLATRLNIYGMPLSCYSMCASGERFGNAVVYPRDQKVCLGDKFTTSMGLRGGLTCRAGYVARDEGDLPEGVRDYVDRVAKPYFAASATWYEAMGLDVTGGQIYHAVDQALPRAIYGWKLNPGHLTATEEWMSSPIYPDSPIQLRSGMMFQMDILPSVPGYGSANAEDGIVLADEALRARLSRQYPDMWRRMMRRRAYMQDVLGLRLKPELMPMSDTVGYLRPLLLNRACALKVRR